MAEEAKEITSVEESSSLDKLYVNDGNKFCQVTKEKAIELLGIGANTKAIGDLSNKVDKNNTDIGKAVNTLAQTVADNKRDADGSVSALNETLTQYAIKNTASGTSINLNDSSEAPILDMEVHSKNLYDINTYPMIVGTWVSKISGAGTKGNDNYMTTNNVPVKHLAGKMINLNKPASGTSPGMAFYDANKVYIPTNTKGVATIVPTNAEYMRFSVDSTATDVQIELGSVATEYEPYTKDIDVTVCGNNIFDGEIEIGGISLVDGSPVTHNTRTRSKNFIKVKPNTTYVLQRNTIGDNRWVIGYDRNKTVISDGNTNGYKTTVGFKKFNTAYPDNITIKTTPTTEYIKWYDTICTDTSEKVMLTEGATLVEYEPYKGQTVTIDTETQTGWEELKTYYPVTNIIPTQSANIDVEYVADTKNYIDNKLIALTALALEG